jgi:N-acetylmuramoyl-L-alanine amidase
VRELHDRLAALGLLSTGDETDDFGDGTLAVVEAFQRSRGLPITGDVDETTWARLLEAGWRLGQRLLYLTHPNLRGDDVAELQVRLAQLGFNPGRIDGVFGELLEEALSDFQRNCALEPSATLTRATLLELVRMTSSGATRSLVNDARDMAGFDDEPSGPLVVCGHSPLAARLARAGAGSMDVTLLSDDRPVDVAAYANANAAAAVISVQTLKQIEGVHLHYWASYLSHSRRGEQLASAIAAALARSQQFPRVEVTGMALPILRETKMTTLHIEHGVGSDEALEELAQVIALVLAEVFHRQP